MANAVVPDVVRSSALFAGLTEEVKNDLLRSGKICRIPKGKTIFSAGDDIINFYIIIEGMVKLYRVDPEGSEKTTDILTSGNTMCEREFFHPGQIHRVNAEALKEVTAMAFPILWLKETAQKHSNFALNLLSLVAQHDHMAEVEAEHKANMSAAQMVACFLQRTCIIHDFNPKGFELPYSKKLIASRLGIEMETFSRTLSKLHDNGIIVSGTRVSFQDHEALEEFVCGSCSIADDCATHKAMQNKTMQSLNKMA